MLAKQYATPVTVWLAMPLYELREWILANNALVEEMEREQEKRRKH